MTSYMGSGIRDMTKERWKHKQEWKKYCSYDEEVKK